MLICWFFISICVSGIGLNFSKAGLLPNSNKFVNHHGLLCFQHNIIKTKTSSLILSCTRHRLRCVEVVCSEHVIVATPFAGPKGLFQTLVLAPVLLYLVLSRKSEKCYHYCNNFRQMNKIATQKNHN